ncbi:hypothetical protein QZH41_013213 [Actinostola sp. cb2023]|nr:hypothetical protein QZH41_013213 [Actinostola sp. cb2023]
MTTISSEEPAAKIPKTDEESVESDSHESHEPSGAFSSPWHFSDVVLIVEGQRFHVHKSTLSMSSPVFEAMFTSEFIEKTALEIPLPGKRADEVETLLCLIYFKKKEHVTRENFEFLLTLADEYQMGEVKELCAQFMTSIFSTNNCLELCRVADCFGLKDVISKCVEEAKSLTMSTIEDDTHYADISPEVKVQICTERIKALEEVLDQYSSTCLDLVRVVYPIVANTLNDVCDNYQMHPQPKRSEPAQPRRPDSGSGFAFAPPRTTATSPDKSRKKFKFSCSCCVRRLEHDWPKEDLTGVMNLPLKTLRLLESQFDAINKSERCH